MPALGTILWLLRTSGMQLPRVADAILAFVSVALNLASVGCFVRASRHGPVSVVMPLITGAKLLSSMYFQISQGMGKYGKSLRIGTTIVVRAALLLIDNGPTAETAAPVQHMLEATSSRVFLGSMVLLLLVCVFLHHIKGHQSVGIALASLSLVVAISTALGASVGKLMSITSGYERMACTSLYLVCGVFSFGYNAVAAFNCNMGVFMPLSECLQLFCNCGAGLYLWEDAQHLRSPSTCFIVYLLLFLGTYLCIPLDLMPGGRCCDRRSKRQNLQTASLPLSEPLQNPA